MPPAEFEFAADEAAKNAFLQIEDVFKKGGCQLTLSMPVARARGADQAYLSLCEGHFYVVSRQGKKIIVEAEG